MDMRFDGVNYFSSDARLHYGSVSIKNGYIDRAARRGEAAFARLHRYAYACHAAKRILCRGRSSIGRRTQGACTERHNGVPFRHDGNG